MEDGVESGLKDATDNSYETCLIWVYTVFRKLNYAYIWSKGLSLMTKFLWLQKTHTRSSLQLRSVFITLWLIIALRMLWSKITSWQKGNFGFLRQRLFVFTGLYFIHTRLHYDYFRTEITLGILFNRKLRSRMIHHANTADSDHTAPVGSVWTWFALVA